MGILSGEYAEEAEETLVDLEQGIDVSKKRIDDTHDFQIKLDAIDSILAHRAVNYEDIKELYPFFDQLEEEIVQLRESLASKQKEAIHFILLEEASNARGPIWVIRHKPKVSQSIHEEERVARLIVKEIQASFRKILELFQSNSSLFLITSSGLIEVIHPALSKKRDELTHILMKLFGFFTTYEHLLTLDLKKLQAVPDLP